MARLEVGPGHRCNCLQSQSERVDWQWRLLRDSEGAMILGNATALLPERKREKNRRYRQKPKTSVHHMNFATSLQLYKIDNCLCKES